MSQRSFASTEYALKKKRTRREQFLEEMERIVLWARLETVVAPSHPQVGRIGRPPIGVPEMLRMYRVPDKWLLVGRYAILEGHTARANSCGWAT